VSEWMKHTCIVGFPRSGKTTFATDWFRNLPKEHIAIFANIQNEPYFTEFEETWEKPDYSDLKAGDRIVFNLEEPGTMFEVMEEVFNINRRKRFVPPVTLFIPASVLVGYSSRTSPRNCMSFCNYSRFCKNVHIDQYSNPPLSRIS